MARVNLPLLSLLDQISWYALHKGPLCHIQTATAKLSTQSDKTHLSLWIYSTVSSDAVGRQYPDQTEGHILIWAQLLKHC